MKKFLYISSSFILVLALILGYIWFIRGDHVTGGLEGLLGKEVDRIPDDAVLAINAIPDERYAGYGKYNNTYIIFLDKNGDAIGHKELKSTYTARPVMYENKLVFSDQKTTYLMDKQGTQTFEKKFSDSRQMATYITDEGLITWYNHGSADLDQYSWTYSLYKDGELKSGSVPGYGASRGTCRGMPAAVFEENIGEKPLKWNFRIYDPPN